MDRKMDGILAIVFVVLTFLTAMLLIVTLARADDGILTWTANTEADLAGYKVYFSPIAANCTASVPLPGAPLAQIGKVTTFTHANLPAMDGPVCWEISAIDTAAPANESGRSNRVSKVLNNLPPLAPAGLNVVVQ